MVPDMDPKRPPLPKARPDEAPQPLLTGAELRHHFKMSGSAYKRMLRVGLPVAADLGLGKHRHRRHDLQVVVRWLRDRSAISAEG